MNSVQPPAEALLEVAGLTVLFPTELGHVHAVDRVSFSLRRGETIGIVGESGSGKSALVRAVMGLTTKSAIQAGSVRFGGRDLTELGERALRSIWGHEIAMVFQNPMTSLNPVMRIGRQLVEPLRLHLGMPPSAARARAVSLLEMVGVPNPEQRLDAYPLELSGGTCQRVAIAMAISCSPGLLLADEPTTALDVTIQRQILDLLSALQAEHRMAMALITHDLGVVAGRTTSVLVMYAGRVVEAAPTRSIFDEPRHPYTAALLAAIPRIEQPSHARLTAIPGRPADVIDPLPGCRFAARCPAAQPVCFDEDPPMIEEPVGSGHFFACFFPVTARRQETVMAVRPPTTRVACADSPLPEAT